MTDSTGIIATTITENEFKDFRNSLVGLEREMTALHIKVKKFMLFRIRL